MFKEFEIQWKNFNLLMIFNICKRGKILLKEFEVHKINFPVRITIKAF